MGFLKLLYILLGVVCVWGFILFSIWTLILFSGEANYRGEDNTAIGFITLPLAILCAWGVRWSSQQLRRERERVAAGQRGFPVKTVERIQD